MTHKHAEFLRAIADGESPDDWEYRLLDLDAGKYYGARYYLGNIILHPDCCEVRRNSNTHVVNGFTVPAPLRVAPADGTSYFYPILTSEYFFSVTEWTEHPCDITALKRGLVHLTREAAIANSKAMCGIDPEKE